MEATNGRAKSLEIGVVALSKFPLLARYELDAHRRSVEPGALAPEVVEHRCHGSPQDVEDGRLTPVVDAVTRFCCRGNPHDHVAGRPVRDLERHAEDHVSLAGGEPANG